MSYRSKTGMNIAHDSFIAVKNKNSNEKDHIIISCYFTISLL